MVCGVSPDSEQAPRGGIDLGGTKIQTVVVDADNKVLGESRRPDADHRRAGGRRAARWPRRCVRRPRRPASAPATSPASASARPATPTRRPASSPTPATCPAGPAPFRSASTSPSSSGSRSGSATTSQVAVQAEFELGRRQAVRHDPRRLVGHRRRRRADPRRQAVARPRRRRRDRPRGGQARRGPLHLRAAGAAWRPTPGRLAMEIKARKEVKKGAKTDLFKIMEEHGRDRLTSGVWERALKHGDDLADEADRPGGEGARRRGSPPPSTCSIPEAVIIGGGLGSALRREVRPPDRHPDAPPPLHRGSAARDSPGRPRRPRRRDRRGTAGRGRVPTPTT